MTVIQTCDHHDEYGLVPSNRSRARILEQLTAATALSEAVGVAFQAARMRQAPSSPLVVVSLDEAIPLMRAWLTWIQVAPMGDDWTPPVVPPAEVRVPPIDDDTTEAS